MTFPGSFTIEADDFMEEPVKAISGCSPATGALKTTYIVRCIGCKRTKNGNVVEVCGIRSRDPGAILRTAERLKALSIRRTPKTALDAEVRLYGQTCFWTRSRRQATKDFDLAES